NYALNVSVTIYNLKPNTQYTYLATMGIAKGTERSFTTLAEGVTPTLAAVSPTATPRISPTPTRRRDAPTISRRGASASTRPATNITSTTATLSANVSSNGHRLEIWYEYWEAASPDVKMTTSSRSYLNIVTIDTRDVSGLQPDTAYVYRAVIKVYYLGLNPLTLYMNQVSFTTLP
ncbi:MAG TPA: hypothetical protein VHY08_08940, partial [Bacillota bacterium]|nr:hypothetical protein [Bacillota bacterium]